MGFGFDVLKPMGDSDNGGGGGGGGGDDDDVVFVGCEAEGDASRYDGW